MTITTTASETYEQRLDNAVEVANELEPGTATASVSPASVPKLFWASVSLFAVNVLVLSGIALSPELRVTVYGEDRPGYISDDSKPSPFTEVVDTAKPRKVKLAQRVTPVLYQEPVMADPSLAPTELAVPRASQVAAASTVSTAPSSATLRGDAVYRAAESYGDFRRVTAMSRELVPPTPRRVTN
jgi:hypothetical protein